MVGERKLKKEEGLGVGRIMKFPCINGRKLEKGTYSEHS